MSKLLNGLALLVDASSMSEQASPSNDAASPIKQPLDLLASQPCPSLSLHARANETTFADPSTCLTMATLPLPFTSSAAMMALPPADNSAAANPHAILQAQQAMQLMAMQGAWYQAIQIQALQQQAIVALQVASQARDQAGQPKAKRAKQARARSPSYAVDSTRTAPRLSADAKVKQICSSCNTTGTPQWRHIKMPRLRVSTSDESASVQRPSSSSSNPEDTVDGEVFITVCNACALRFRKKCCICGACKFIPSSTYSGHGCSRCGQSLLQGRSNPANGTTTYHAVA